MKDGCMVEWWSWQHKVMIKTLFLRVMLTKKNIQKREFENSDNQSRALLAEQQKKANI